MVDIQAGHIVDDGVYGIQFGVGGGHTRKTQKLVQQVLHAFHFLRDDPDAFIEYLGEGLLVLVVFLFQTLRIQLNRR